MQKRNGFTLVEVLCVIAIISILTAIAFPMRQESIRSAKRQSASNNLKQIWIAFEVYRQDHEGERLPGPNPWSAIGASVDNNDLFPHLPAWRPRLKLWRSPCSPHPSDISPYMIFFSWRNRRRLRRTGVHSNFGFARHLTALR